MSPTPKKALIIGSGGQDGTLLKDFLIQSGDIYFGVTKTEIETNLTGFDASKLAVPNLTDGCQVENIVKKLQPDEIYYLAAFHHSSEQSAIADGALAKRSYDIHCVGAYQFLEAIRNHCPHSRFFYAASSLVFGMLSTPTRQDETTAYCPGEIYGITKTAGILTCQAYRKKYGIFASAGILYNHESKFRGSQFVTQKIAQAARSAAQGRPYVLELGNLDAMVDWSDAHDVVRAMTAILRTHRTEDFIVASGTLHSVREFATIAYDLVGLNAEKWIKQREGILVRPQIPLCGDPGKLKLITGWRAKLTFQDMIREMVLVIEPLKKE